MRLERVRRGLDLCVMVRGNGEYHLERHTSDKARIFEGNLNADETRQLIRIVSADQLYDLEQTQISDPMLRSEFDQVFLSVLRPIDSWQKLSFPDPQSREPYRESLVPLLDWLDKLQKHNASELPEVTGRNNCLPPRDLELRQRVQIGQNPPALSPGHGTAQATPHLPQLGTRSAQDPATTRQPYILKIQEGRFGWKKTTLSCAIISASGKYHLVKQTEDSGSSKVRSAVLDGTLDEKQIAALRQILDAPELRSASSEKPPPVFTSPLEGESIHIALSFSREGTVYKSEGWRALHVEGRTITSTMEEHGMKSLISLQEWLKANVDESKASIITNPPNGRCAQEP